MIGFYFATPDSGPSRDLTTTEALIMWGMVIFLFFVMPRLFFFFVGRNSRQSFESETTTHDDFAISLDDDWSDIEDQIKKERQ